MLINAVVQKHSPMLHWSIDLPLISFLKARSTNQRFPPKAWQSVFRGTHTSAMLVEEDFQGKGNWSGSMAGLCEGYFCAFERLKPERYMWWDRTCRAAQGRKTGKFRGFPRVNG